MTRKLARLTLLAGITALAGCNATPELQMATSEAFSPEWCQAAKAFPESGGHPYSVGRCHERGVSGFVRDDNVIAYYYTQAARWGSTDAGAALARLDRPVPDADLLAEARYRADRDRENRRITQAIAGAPPPPAQPRSLIGVSPIGTGFQPLGAGVRPIGTGLARPPVSAFPAAPVPGNTNVNVSTSTRRNCVNNVCRTERTTCTNGVCRTEVLP